MSMSYQALLHAGLKDPTCDAVATAIEHAPGDVYMSNLSRNIAGIEAVLVRDTKFMERLVAASEVGAADVDWALQLNHKPTTGIANKISMHTQQLSQTAVDYVVTHGRKVALANLIERQGWFMDPATLERLQEELFTKYHTLRCFTSVTTPSPVQQVDSSAWLHQITAGVTLLDKSTERHEKEKRFKETAGYLAWLAIHAGVPTRYADSIPALTSRAVSTEAILADLRNTTPREVQFNAVSGRRWVALMFNDEVLEAFEALPVEEQVTIYEKSPTWPALERMFKAHGDDVAVRYDLRIPAHFDAHYPTVDLLRKLSPRRLGYASGSASQVLNHVAESFGDDAGMWSTFGALYHEWDQTLGDLIDTVISTA